MATQTETVVPHPTVDPVDEQKIEEIVDEVKAVKEESSTPCKDIGEEDDSIKVEESQLVTSILAKSEEEEAAPKLESPAIEIKTEDVAADEEDDQIKPIPESQIPEDIKAVVEEAVDPPPAECVEQLIKDGEAEPEEKTSAGLPAELESEEPAIAEVRDKLEPAENPVISVEPPANSVEGCQEFDEQPITDPPVQEGASAGLLAELESEEPATEPAETAVVSIEPPADSVERGQEYDEQPIPDPQVQERASAGLPTELESEEPAENPVVSIKPPADSVEPGQEYDDQPNTDPQVQGVLLADTSAEKEQDDQPSVESVTEKEEEQSGLTSVERELDNEPSMEAVIREEEEAEHLTIASSEKEQGEQQPEESVLKEAEENPSLVSYEKAQEEQLSINLEIKEAEDQLEVESVEKTPEDQPLVKPTVEEVQDQSEVEREDQPSLSEKSIPASEVECQPTIETEQPEPVLPGEELEPAIVKETTYSDSAAINVEAEPTTTIETEQPEPVQPGEELEPAIVKETTYSDSAATNVEAEPTTTIEMEQPVLVLPGEELEPAIVKEATYSDSGATNVESEPTTSTEMEQPEPVLPEEELEAAIVKEPAYSESRDINDENLQQEAATLDDKQTEQLQNTDEACEPQEDVPAETVKDEGILAVDAENTTLVKEEVCKEVKEEERVEQSESAGGEDSAPFIPESIKEELNEPSTVEINAKLPKDVVLTDEKFSEKDEESADCAVKTEEGNKETEGVISQVTTVEDVGSSLPAANVAKISTDEEKSCLEVDPIAENKIEEDVKDENAAVTETSELECVEKSVDNLTTVTGDTKEVSTERSVELSTEEMVDQITKLDVENQDLSTKEGEESKSSENQEKEVPSKPAQKHSNNLLSKVKQSLVKAKKAIIGKSPGSKNIPSETKGDIQVK